VIGTVANALSGASTVPMMPAEPKMTVALAPASAWAAASTSALRRANRSSVTGTATGSAIADMAALWSNQRGIATRLSLSRNG